MPQTVKLSAFLVANQLDIKGIKTFLDIKPLADTSSELFYRFSEAKFQYYFNFGVIVLAGYTEDEMKWSIKAIKDYQRNMLNSWLRDDLLIETQEEKQIVFDFAKLIVDKCDDRVIRITMFNLAQSVALDHYHDVTETLLTEVKGFANQLEATGRLKISRKNMMRYIFDAPDLVWDDEYLDKVHQGLSKHFDLKVRFSEIEYTLRIIEDNLSVFREIINQRESSILEIIIIVLILVEIVDLLLTKLLKLY